MLRLYSVTMELSVFKSTIFYLKKYTIFVVVFSVISSFLSYFLINKFVEKEWSEVFLAQSGLAVSASNFSSSSDEKSVMASFFSGNSSTYQANNFVELISFVFSKSQRNDEFRIYINEVDILRPSELIKVDLRTDRLSTFDNERTIFFQRLKRVHHDAVKMQVDALRSQVEHFKFQKVSAEKKRVNILNVVKKLGFSPVVRAEQNLLEELIGRLDLTVFHLEKNINEILNFNTIRSESPIKSPVFPNTRMIVIVLFFIFILFFFALFVLIDFVKNEK